LAEETAIESRWRANEKLGGGGDDEPQAARRAAAHRAVTAWKGRTTDNVALGHDRARS
jgi:hypothetical protein